MSDTPPLTPPIFGRSALQKQVDLALGTLPEGKKGCLVAMDAGKGWVEIVTFVKFSNAWQVAGRLRHERASGYTGRVEIRACW